MAYIYKITNSINGKVYIGKTSNTIETRWAEHKRDSRKERCEKRPLYDAMNKYGIDNFQIEEIEEVENDEIACERESYWIDYYHSYVGYDDCKGYNATKGGDGIRIYDYKEIAEKYKELQNQKETAKYFNCDTDIVRNACIENGIEIKSGQEVSKEKCSKPIAQLNKDTLEIIKIYSSSAEVFKALGKTKGGGLAKACKEDKIYQGYKWRYI